MLRAIVRRAILAWLVHGDPPGEKRLIGLCDRRMLSTEVLAQLREPLKAYDDVVLPGMPPDP
jgi:hypothetical protein